MRSYSELNRRINPFWEEVMNLLIDDENQNQTPEVADRNQVSQFVMTAELLVKFIFYSTYHLDF